MRNWFTLAGVDSRDFGVYISGQQTFGSPAKSYDEYDIPGRNGLLLGSNHKIGNAEIVYAAGISSNFEENLANLRTFLASLDGYQRLEDTYHPDEYRMAVFTDGIDPDVTQMNDAGEFEITFSCLPQRFLKSGETEYTPLSGVIRGNPISTDTGDIDSSDIGLVVSVPFWNGDDYGQHRQGFSPVSQLNISVNSSDNIVWSHTLNKKVIQGEFNVRTGGRALKICEDVPLTGWQKVAGYGSRFSVAFSPSGPIEACSSLAFISGVNPTTGTICYDQTNSRLVTSVSGNVTTVAQLEAWLQSNVTQVIESVNQAMTWSDSAFTLPAGRNELRSPTNTLMSVEITGSNVLTNPTRFPSKPLIRLYGTGAVDVNGITITVSTCDTYVDIDCDMMDCYEGSTNRNKDVTFSTYDFPELAPGDNTFEVNSGITGITVVPRWWRL